MSVNSNRIENRKVTGQTGITLPQNGQNINNITCFYCHKTWHIAMNCRNWLNDEMKVLTSNQPQGTIAKRKVLVGYRPFMSKG